MLRKSFLDRVGLVLAHVARYVARAAGWCSRHPEVAVVLGRAAVAAGAPPAAVAVAERVAGALAEPRQ